MKRGDLTSPETVNSMSNGELCGAGREILGLLEGHLKSRRGRERALELCTQFYLVGAKLAERFGKMEFQAAVRHEDDEEELGEEFDAHGVAHSHVGMAELLSGFDEGQSSFREWSEAQKAETRAGRLSALQDLLDYFFAEARSIDEVLVKLLAVTRRLRPRALERFGLSQAAVGRRLGVGRATVSAREKRLVEQPLKHAGARGITSNGARGASTSEACARAAEGNSNRAGKKARRSTLIHINNNKKTKS